jgi:GNAT superfamily N-acetyltransferase
VEIQKADGIVDFSTHVPDIEDIFFQSSAKRDFCTEKERQSFREKWLGRYILKHRDSFFVAFDDAGRAIGYLAGCLENPTTLYHFNDIGYLSFIDDICQIYPGHFHVNVAEQCRNHGLGVVLVEQFANWARFRAVPGIHLVTSSTSRSVPFYRRSGFSELRTFPWNSGTAVCMGRKL